MDFFERQEYARRQSRRLVVLFVLSVVAIVLLLYLVAAVLMGEAMAEPGVHAERPPQAGTIWYPELFLTVAGGTVLVIALGSLYKIAELSAGGQKVALLLGGRQIPPHTTDLAERRLLNIVEEMSLASGVPVPPVYVLDHEAGINAFAAGHQPGDAVVAVSRGCLAYLNREELQGVVGHEFSHILNGDMRLNLRLIGIVHGILILAILGYYLLRSAQFSGSGSRKRDGTAAIAAAGLALVILGYLGVFFGNLIKSAISRQREYLADASAVQFTRYPAGIAGALKKIGGLAEGSRIRDGHAQEISHMFFANALAGMWFNLFATHPPLVDRIRQVEPDFDGRFPRVEPLRIMEPEPPVRGPAEAAVSVAQFEGPAVMAKIGRPAAQDLHRAESTLDALPAGLAALAREPYTARILVWSLLLDRQEPAVRQRQQAVLARRVEPHLLERLKATLPTVDALDPALRLPLVDLATAALKGMSSAQYADFRDCVEELARADERLDLFEYCLRTVVFSYLDVHYGLSRPPRARYDRLAQIAPSFVLVLSSLARAGTDQEAAAATAFRAGARGLLDQAELLPAGQCTLAAFDKALHQLAQSAPLLKKRLLAACTTCVAADARATVVERELLRAVAAALACPMPPLAGDGFVSATASPSV